MIIPGPSNTCRISLDITYEEEWRFFREHTAVIPTCEIKEENKQSQEQHGLKAVKAVIVNSFLHLKCKMSTSDSDANVVNIIIHEKDLLFFHGHLMVVADFGNHRWNVSLFTFPIRTYKAEDTPYFACALGLIIAASSCFSPLALKKLCCICLNINLFCYPVKKNGKI